MAAECSVRVIARFRPFNEREKAEMGSADNSKSGVAITFPSDQSVNIKTPDNPKQVASPAEHSTTLTQNLLPLSEEQRRADIYVVYFPFFADVQPRLHLRLQQSSGQLPAPSSCFYLQRFFHVRSSFGRVCRTLSIKTVLPSPQKTS